MLVKKIDVYSDDWIRRDLYILLREFAGELSGYDFRRNIEVDDFIAFHSAIYIVYKDDKPVGFASYMINDRYGLMEKVITNDYLYILPEFRGSKAIYMLMMQTGKIIEDTNLPLEHCYATDGSSRLGKRLEGKKAYTSYVYTVKEVLREFSKLKKIVKIKD